MVKSWLFYMLSQCHLDPDQMDWQTTQSTYDRYLNLCVRDEELGFEGVFFAEHHFQGMNLTPSPNIMIAAVAQRTQELRLGVMGSVLPLHDARRLAEECGMLDYLTHGRLEIGIGPGAGDAETMRAGVNSDEIRPRYASGAEVMDKYLKHKRVTHCDHFYNLKDVSIVPPMRQPSPPVWVTAMSASSVAWAAQREYKVCTSWMPTAAIAQLSSAYHQAAAEAGHKSDSADFGVRRRVFVASTDAEAQDLAEAAMDPVIWTMKHQPDTALQVADSIVQSMLFHPDDIIVGSPKTVTEILVDQAQTVGFGHIVYFTDFKLFDHADLVRCHDLIGKDVAPVLRSISVDAGAVNAAN